jgi:restriction system protein
LELTRKSYYRITDDGKKVTKENPNSLNMKYLERFPSYIEFRSKKGNKKKRTEKFEQTSTDNQTPEEIIEYAYQEIRYKLALELLVLVKNSTPSFFERLVVGLLVNMGYGGSWEEAAQAVGQMSDEGIDGNRLAELMIDHNVGVKGLVNYQLKRVDSDYFSNL